MNKEELDAVSLAYIKENDKELLNKFYAKKDNKTELEDLLKESIQPYHYDAVFHMKVTTVRQILDQDTDKQDVALIIVAALARVDASLTE